MNDNYMKTILSGVKEWTENLTDDAVDKANNALDKANNALDKALFVVNITQNRDGTYSADKTFEEIVQVYNEGKYNIVANAMGAYRMPLLAIAGFGVFGVIMDGDYFTLLITPNNEVQIEMLPLATLDDTLPNPYPLTFTGAVNETYDGSSAKTIEIPIGADGKSAYSYAQDGGYSGTEAEFAAKLAAESIDKALFVVNITTTDGRTFSADKTFEEITQAYNEGKYNIVVDAGGSRMPFLAIRESTGLEAIFGRAINNGVDSIIITDNNEIKFSHLTLATTKSKLPNPHALTFTGAVNETYDGSSAKTIEIPSGGGGEVIIASSTAGSTKKFKITVDDSGTITATEI